MIRYVWNEAKSAWQDVVTPFADQIQGLAAQISGIIVNATGTSTTKAISQKAATDAIDALRTYGKNYYGLNAIGFKDSDFGGKSKEECFQMIAEKLELGDMVVQYSDPAKNIWPKFGVNIDGQLYTNRFCLEDLGGDPIGKPYRCLNGLQRRVSDSRSFTMTYDVVAKKLLSDWSHIGDF